MKESPIILNKEEGYEEIRLRSVEPQLPGRKKDVEGQMETDEQYHQRFILQRLIPALISQARINERQALPFADLRWQEYRKRLFLGQKFNDENFGDYKNEMKNLVGLQNDLLLIFLSQGPGFSFTQHLPQVLNHIANNSNGLGVTAEGMVLIKACLEEFEIGARFLCNIVKELEKENLPVGVKRSMGTNVVADMEHKIDLFVIDENTDAQEVTVNFLQSQITDVTPDKLEHYQAAHTEFVKNFINATESREEHVHDQKNKVVKELVKSKDILETNLFQSFLQNKFGDRGDVGVKEEEEAKIEFLTQRFGPLAEEIITDYLAEAEDSEEEAIAIIDSIVESKAKEFGEYYPYLIALSAVKDKSFCASMLDLQELGFLAEEIDLGDIKKFSQLMKKWAQNYLQRFPISFEIADVLYGPLELHPDFVSKYPGYKFSFNSLVVTRNEKHIKRLLTQNL